MSPGPNLLQQPLGQSASAMANMQAQQTAGRPFTLSELMGAKTAAVGVYNVQEVLEFLMSLPVPGEATLTYQELYLTWRQMTGKVAEEERRLKEHQEAMLAYRSQLNQLHQNLPPRILPATDFDALTGTLQTACNELTNHRNDWLDSIKYALGFKEKK